MLTAEALADILRSLRADRASPHDKLAGNRLRLDPRVGVRLPLTILPLGGNGPSQQAIVQVSVRNFGPRGLGFLHREPLAVGQSFIIRLPRAVGGVECLLGQTARCRSLGGGLYDIGASIRLNAPRAEVEALLAKAA